MNKDNITQEQLDKLIKENRRLKREKREYIRERANYRIGIAFWVTWTVLGMYLAITTQTEVEQLQQIITQLTV